MQNASKRRRFEMKNRMLGVIGFVENQLVHRFDHWFWQFAADSKVGLLKRVEPNRNGD